MGFLQSAFPYIRGLQFVFVGITIMFTVAMHVSLIYTNDNLGIYLDRGVFCATFMANTLYTAPANLTAFCERNSASWSKWNPVYDKTTTINGLNVARFAANTTASAARQGLEDLLNTPYVTGLWKANFVSLVLLCICAGFIIIDFAFWFPSFSEDHYKKFPKYSPAIVVFIFHTVCDALIRGLIFFPCLFLFGNLKLLSPPEAVTLWTQAQCHLMPNPYDLLSLGHVSATALGQSLGTTLTLQIITCVVTWGAINALTVPNMLAAEEVSKHKRVGNSNTLRDALLDVNDELPPSGTRTDNAQTNVNTYRALDLGRLSAYGGGSPMYPLSHNDNSMLLAPPPPSSRRYNRRQVE
jgi:hypothetical protein